MGDRDSGLVGDLYCSGCRDSLVGTYIVCGCRDSGLVGDLYCMWV